MTVRLLLANAVFIHMHYYLCVGFAELPSLFLTVPEKEWMSDLVLLDPKWLLDIMKLLMELSIPDASAETVDQTKPVYDPIHLDNLKETGIASELLLRKCWEGYYSETEDEVTFPQLCLMLQAYGLIYPVERCSPLNPSDRTPTYVSSLQPLTQSDGTLSSIRDFLVPCMLPEQNEESQDEKQVWITFYYDFSSFLPEVIYHRLICLMLAQSEAQGSKQSLQLTKGSSKFNDIGGYRDSRWKIEIVKDVPKLRICVRLVQFVASNSSIGISILPLAGSCTTMGTPYLQQSFLM